MGKKDVLVILPAFNEAECIGAFLDKLKESGVCERADVIVINDGSTDKTSQIVKNRGFEIITQIYNLGYGCALQTGYKYAVRNNYEYLIQIDSDGQHDVCNIENILNELKKDEFCDIVIGSRFLDESVSFKISGVKRFVIKFFRFIIKRSTKQVVLDPTSGLQGIRRRAFLYYSYYNNFVSNYPDANMIIQMLLNDFRIKETTAVMHARETGKSMHSGLKPVLYIFRMILNTMVVIMRERFKKRR